MYQFNSMKNSQSGQTIIEAVVALMTILLIMTAIAIVIISGLYNSRFIKNQNEANKYAQEGMEFVRSIQENDIEQFASYGLNSTYCLDEANSALTTSGCSATGVNTGASYNRVVVLSGGGGECPGTQAKVTVTVSWISSKCASGTFCHKSQLVACLPYAYSQSTP